MTDIVNVLRMNDEGDEWTNIRTFFLRQAADEIERLRTLASYLTEERRRLRVEAGYD